MSDREDLDLDELYYLVAFIYGGQNARRNAYETFAHLVEACGMVAIDYRKKGRERFTTVEALCKALGWYFPLLAKFQVRSVEDLLFRKFPYVCPYCGLAPHEESVCKEARGKRAEIDQNFLRRAYLANQRRRPRTLDDWQQMFQAIYPRTAGESERNILGLFEELGEFAESIRVFSASPRYFLGEAADVFSYLMGIANEAAMREAAGGRQPFSLEAAMLANYPGLCKSCGMAICTCPTNPDATVGRLSKEIDVKREDNMFFENYGELMSKGREVACRWFKRSPNSSEPSK